MNKIDLLEELEGILYHNLLCYSENYLMNKPKEKFVKEWEETKVKIDLAKEIKKDVQRNIQEKKKYILKSSRQEETEEFE